MQKLYQVQIFHQEFEYPVSALWKGVLYRILLLLFLQSIGCVSEEGMTKVAISSILATMILKMQICQFGYRTWPHRYSKLKTDTSNAKAILMRLKSIPLNKWEIIGKNLMRCWNLVKYVDWDHLENLTSGMSVRQCFKIYFVNCLKLTNLTRI